MKVPIEAPATHRVADSIGALVATNEDHAGNLPDGAVAMNRCPIPKAPDPQSDPHSGKFRREQEDVSIGHQRQLHDLLGHVEGVGRFEIVVERRSRQDHETKGHYCDPFRQQQCRYF